MISYPENYRPIDRQNNTFIIYVKKVFDHGKKTKKWVSWYFDSSF